MDHRFRDRLRAPQWHVPRSAGQRREPSMRGLRIAVTRTSPTQAAARDTLLTCRTDLSLIDRKLHEDYAGYTLELRGARLRAFAAMKERALAAADTATGDACWRVLDNFVSWFDDP